MEEERVKKRPFFMIATSASSASPPKKRPRQRRRKRIQARDPIVLESHDVGWRKGGLFIGQFSLCPRELSKNPFEESEDPILADFIVRVMYWGAPDPCARLGVINPGKLKSALVLDHMVRSYIGCMPLLPVAPDLVLIEYQHKFSRGIMLAAAGIHAAYIARSHYEPAFGSPSIEYVSAKKKLRHYKGPQCITAGRGNHDARKIAATERVLQLFTEIASECPPAMMDQYNDFTLARRDDACDAFLQAFEYIWAKWRLPETGINLILC